MYSLRYNGYFVIIIMINDTPYYAQSQYQFGSEVTSASFAFNWSRGRGTTLTRAARRYAFCVYTEQALILSDVTTKLLVTWIVGVHMASIVFSTVHEYVFFSFSLQVFLPARRRVSVIFNYGVLHFFQHLDKSYCFQHVVNCYYVEEKQKWLGSKWMVT